MSEPKCKRCFLAEWASIHTVLQPLGHLFEPYGKLAPGERCKCLACSNARPEMCLRIVPAPTVPR